MWTKASDLDYEDRMLWAGVLRRAVYDYVLYKGHGRHKRRWQRASQFIFGDRPEGEEVWFEEVCGVFGWEPEYIRRKTRELNRAGIKKLETSKFRDEFDTNPMRIIINGGEWEGLKGAVPFFTPYNYNNSVKKLMELRTVFEEKTESFVPLIWAGA